MALPTACLNTSAGFGTIFNGYRPHGTAQIRRGITIGRGQPQRAEIFALPVSRGNQIFEDEDDDEGRGRLMLPHQSFIRLNVIHVPYDMVVLHLDCVNLLRVTFDHPFTANIAGNP